MAKVLFSLPGAVSTLLSHSTCVTFFPIFCKLQNPRISQQAILSTEGRILKKECKVYNFVFFCSQQNEHLNQSLMRIKKQQREKNTFSHSLDFSENLLKGEFFWGQIIPLISVRFFSVKKKAPREEFCNFGHNQKIKPK